MENIICVGTPACKVGLEVSKRYKNYQIWLIDDVPTVIPKKRSVNFHLFTKYDSPEDYESLYDENVEKFLDKVKKGQVVFVVCGASLVSGALLRLMEKVKKTTGSPMELLYIKPETVLMSETKKLQERVVFNVMQQYARSGVLTRMTIVSNESLDSLVIDAPLAEHFEKVNEIIASTFHMIKVFDNTTSVVDTFSPPRPSSRISTLLVFNPLSESETETEFYPLQSLTEARYYYGIPTGDLKEEKNLYRQILTEMKKRVEKFSKVSYGIYETSYDTKIGYAILYSNKIQELNI